MTTFSQLVDDVIRETRRPDMVREAADYLNQTIREAHTHPQNNAMLTYDENLVEVLLTANVDSGFGWDIPNPATFQAMQAVHYRTRDVWPDSVTPSRGLRDRRDYYYRAGRHFSFSDYGGINAQIALAYYEFPSVLAYYLPGQRPCEWTPEGGFTYATPFDTPQLRPAAEAYCTNWLLLRWGVVLKEGLRAKIYKRLGDDTRARTCYSLYQSLRTGLATSESGDLGGHG
jgi:hypothetical protein